jgi:hypothetical protein
VHELLHYLFDLSHGCVPRRVRSANFRLSWIEAKPGESAEEAAGAGR